MVVEYENTLRRLIITTIGYEDSAPYKISPDRILKWKEKRDIETKKKKGINSENRIIYYSDFYDLKNIISNNWELFSPILINKRRFEVFFTEIENARNTVAHGRNLTLSEENLVNGINSDLKNLITIYHNKNEMKDDFFIELVRITDNLGTIWEEGRTSKNPTVRVGDEYELIIEANDPKSREIEYEIFTTGINYKKKQKSNRFNINITNDLVSKFAHFYVVARTPGSEYKNEASQIITMTILPK